MGVLEKPPVFSFFVARQHGNQERIQVIQNTSYISINWVRPWLNQATIIPVLNRLHPNSYINTFLAGILYIIWLFMKYLYIMNHMCIEMKYPVQIHGFNGCTYNLASNWLLSLTADKNVLNDTGHLFLHWSSLCVFCLSFKTLRSPIICH